jgi:hypothetical protein
LILEIILASLIQVKTIQKQPEAKNDIQLSAYILPASSNNDIHRFTVGESLSQGEEAARISAEASNKASQRSYANDGGGSSYTGQGSGLEIVGDSSEQCVVYAKRRSGITRTIGYAGNARIQGSTPQVGAIGIEKSKIGHAVYVEAIDGDNIIITEANYKAGTITKRVLALSQIKGYIYN